MWMPSVYVLTLTFDPELWVVIVRIADTVSVL